MPIHNNNLYIHPEMEEMFKKTYIQLRNAFTHSHPDMPVSIGARLQANNSEEVILTQDGHRFDVLAGNHQSQTFNLNVICFANDYVTAAQLGDIVLEYFADKELYTDYAVVDMEAGGALSMPEKQWTYKPKSQLMYYTDEDDYAVAVKMDVIITRK